MLTDLKRVLCSSRIGTRGRGIEVAIFEEARVWFVELKALSTVGSERIFQEPVILPVRQTVGWEK